MIKPQCFVLPVICFQPWLFKIYFKCWHVFCCCLSVKFLEFVNTKLKLIKIASSSSLCLNKIFKLKDRNKRRTLFDEAFSTFKWKGGINASLIQAVWQQRHNKAVFKVMSQVNDRLWFSPLYRLSCRQSAVKS